jgi:hypothetical protein
MNQPPYISSNMCEDCIKHLKNIGCSVPCTLCKMKECVKCKIDLSIRINTKFCKRVGCFHAVHNKTDFCEDCTDSRTFLKECIKNTYKQLKMYKKEFKRFDKNSIVDSDNDDDSDGCVNELQYCPRMYPNKTYWYPKSPFVPSNNNSNKCTYSIGPDAREVSKEEFDNQPSTIKN